MENRGNFFIFLFFSIFFFSACQPEQGTASGQTALRSETKDENSSALIINSTPIQKESTPLITREDERICEKRRDAYYYEKIPLINPNGKIAYVAEGINLVNPDDNTIETVYPAERGKYHGRYYFLAWSPDGTMLAVIHDWEGELGYSLEVVDFPSGVVCSLLEGREAISRPAWSPDSRNLSVVDKGTKELVNIKIPDFEILIIDSPAKSHF
ncbi:MAG: hypothetical protein JW929_05645 [Anaerolineales bacterium]|nr:hypothetical protein [Anaerolineales bacterium]